MLSKHGGRERARKLYPHLGKCERCKVRPAVDRHHKDGNTSNNVRKNIAFLCRRCHEKVDGRAEVLRRFARAQVKNPIPKWKRPGRSEYVKAWWAKRCRTGGVTYLKTSGKCNPRKGWLYQ